MNAAVALGVFVASSCARESPPLPPLPPAYSSSAGRSSAAEYVIEVGFATYYAGSLAGRRTASGESYDPLQLTAAHRTLPFGTMVEVRRADGRRVTVRVNDRGPYASGRVIDLSHRAAEELGIVQDGKAWVELRRVAVPTAPPVVDGR
jgi:peptidoglycan lytic transglycosylase